MEKISDERMKQIYDRMLERGIKLPCPRCGSAEPFVITNGYSRKTVHSTTDGPILISDITVPSIITACSQCGFLSQHSTNILGLAEKVG